MLSTPQSSFHEHYESLISSGAIERDPAQAEVADAFAALEQRLANYKPSRKNGLLGRLFAD
jgi:cell division protein ZapE